MKALFLVAIISNFISIISNISIAEFDKSKKKGDRRTMKVEKIKERLYFNGTMDEYMELMNP